MKEYGEMQQSSNVLKAVGILWDVDEEDGEVDLPDEVVIPEGILDTEEISDYLTHLTGFCHKGFALEVPSDLAPEKIPKAPGPGRFPHAIV